MSYSDGVPGTGLVDQQTVTIANNGTVSTAIDLGGHKFMAILMPSAFTGTAMTFQGSQDGTTYTAIYDSAGSAVSITVSTSRFVAMASATMTLLAPFRYLKLVSGSTEGGARTIEVILK